MPPFEIFGSRPNLAINHYPPTLGSGGFGIYFDPMAGGAAGSMRIGRKVEQILNKALNILNKMSEVKRNSDEIKIETAESSFPGYSHILQRLGIGERKANTSVSTEYGCTDNQGSIFINYGKMKDDFPDDTAAQEACLTLTLLHELEHNYWRLEDVKRGGEPGRKFNVEALNEGCTELHSRRIMETSFQKEFTVNKGKMYEEYLGIAEALVETIGWEQVQKAFFTKETMIIANELASLDQSLAFEFFEKVDALSERMDFADKSEVEKRCGEIASILQKLKGRRYATLEEVQASSDKIWGVLGKIYPGLTSKNQTPPEVIAKGSIDGEESPDNRKNITMRYHKSRKIAVELNRGREETDLSLLDAAFLMYFEFDNRVLKEPLANEIVASIERFLREELDKAFELTPNPDSINRQYCELGGKLFGMVGTQGLAQILRDRRNKTIYDLIEKKYGEDARKILESGPGYIDHMPTAIFLQLFAAEKFAAARKTGGFAKIAPWAGFEPVTFQQFKREFDMEPHKATFKLSAYAAPYLAPYYRTLAASSILVYLNLNGRLNAEEVAAFALMLSTNQMGRIVVDRIAYAAMFNVQEENGWTVANYINMKVMENMAANGDRMGSLFAGISSREEVSKLCHKIEMEFEGRTDDERQKLLEKDVYSRLAKNIVKAGTRERTKEFSFGLGMASEVDQPYVDRIASGARGYYEAQSYADSEANPARIWSFANSANKILNEFAIECTRKPRQLDVFENSVDGLTYASLPNGVQVPIVPELSLDAPNMNQEINAAQAQFANVAESAGSMAVFTPDTVLFDSSQYDTDLAAKMKSVFDRNPEAAAEFFNMSRGTGECVVGGYYFVTP